MKFALILAFGALLAAGLAAPVGAAPPAVVFSKQVLPILNRECVSCHRGSAAPGGYSMESAERLVAGGRHGVAVVPRSAAAGTLVRYLTGQLQPRMPPGKPLALDTIALIRRWIDEGGKIDTMVAPQESSGLMRGAMPLKTKGGRPMPVPLRSGTAGDVAAVSQAAPVTAVAYAPSGRWVAVGGYRAVRLLDPATGNRVQTLTGPVDQVLAIQWSPDGRHLAAAGGSPGSFGEVCVWDVPAEGAWGKPRVLRDHTDTLYGFAWRPTGDEFATGSLDKTARVWDLASGKVKRVLRDHVDAVMSVAYSPDGKWLATGSMDRTVKLYDAASGSKVGNLSHGDGVTAIAFAPRSDILAAASADKVVRVWPVKPGNAESPLRDLREDEPVTCVAFSGNGSLFLWGASNRRVRIWSGDAATHRRELRDCPDWIYSVSASPDGKTVAAGGGDGKIYFWGADDGKLLRAVPVGGPDSGLASAGGVK